MSVPLVVSKEVRRSHNESRTGGTPAPRYCTVPTLYCTYRVVKSSGHNPQSSVHRLSTTRLNRVDSRLVSALKDEGPSLTTTVDITPNSYPKARFREERVCNLCLKNQREQGSTLREDRKSRPSSDALRATI